MSSTLLQALNEQYPNREGYKITHMKFKFDESQDPFIEVVHPNDHPRVSAIAMEPTPGQVLIVKLYELNSTIPFCHCGRSKQVLLISTRPARILNQ